MSVKDYQPLEALSPLDGRYQGQLRALAPFFSEFALIQNRLRIEIEYLITLSRERKFTALAPLPPADQTTLRTLYRDLTPAAAGRVKEIEATTNHDVKAVEYYLREQVRAAGLPDLVPWLHFALTSEDVNNLAYALMYTGGLRRVILPELKKVHRDLRTLARRHARDPLLALTHGQPATPTTLGKELAVFAARLHRQIAYLDRHVLTGKLSGASGTWAAHVVAGPQVDWPAFSRRFIKSLGLEPNLLTTQIEPHDSRAESCQALIRVNTILLDLCRDLWLYVSRGIFRQKSLPGEVGSSTMPHKVNPIRFENAEGNLGLANALLAHLAHKLPVSRLQRDLSDSTVLRNQGVPLGHTLLALKNIRAGLQRLTVDRAALATELDQHWEVLAEAAQTILRQAGREDAYEALRQLTCGRRLDRQRWREFIAGLDLPEAERCRLAELTPATYLGLAPEIAEWPK